MEPPSSHPLRRVRRPPAVVEVMGLPGIGKSAACRALLARIEGSATSGASMREKELRWSILPKLLLPLTLLRYRHVLRALRPRDGPSWPRVRAFLLHFRWPAGRLWRAEDPLVSTLFMLTTSLNEIALARLEARLRRRTLILDEGFAHRTLGVSIRAAPEARDAVVAAYLDTIPAGSAGILLRCDAETARTRAANRARDIPTAVRRAAEALGSQTSMDDAIATIYREQAEVFELEPLRARLQLQEVEAEGTPEEIAARIEAALRCFDVNRRLLVFLRK